MVQDRGEEAQKMSNGAATGQCSRLNWLKLCFDPRRDQAKADKGRYFTAVRV